MELAKAFFVERGHPVAETFVERGYVPEEEVKKHAAADLVILQTPLNWFSAPWITKNMWTRFFNVGLAKDVFLAGDGRTSSSTSRPTTSSQATTFFRIMESSIFSRTPTFRARLKNTSGIWRNTAYDLSFFSWRT
jgi:multimeric flavodoxin WrbA